MRNYILPAALAAMMALAPVASASPGTASAGHPAETPKAAHFARLHGVIHSVDAKAHTLTLDDGRTFSLPADVTPSSLKTGEKVSLEWSWTGNERVAKDVTTN